MLRRTQKGLESAGPILYSRKKIQENELHWYQKGEVGNLHSAPLALFGGRIQPPPLAHGGVGKSVMGRGNDLCKAWEERRFGSFGELGVGEEGYSAVSRSRSHRRGCYAGVAGSGRALTTTLKGVTFIFVKSQSTRDWCEKLSSLAGIPWHVDSSGTRTGLVDDLGPDNRRREGSG